MYNITHNGRRINGQFDSFWAKLRRGWNYTVLGFKFLVFTALMISIGFFFGKTGSVVAHYNTVNTFPQKIEELKADVVTRLGKDCESKGTNSDKTPDIFDTNGKGSYGEWRWQIKSVVYFYKKLYSQDITNKEALLIALDDAKARKLTTDVIFTVPGGIENWLNCDKKLGLSAEVKVIKQLEK